MQLVLIHPLNKLLFPFNELYLTYDSFQMIYIYIYIYIYLYNNKLTHCHIYYNATYITYIYILHISMYYIYINEIYKKSQAKVIALCISKINLLLK